MHKRAWLNLVLVGLVATACGDKKPNGSGECAANRDCDAGEICDTGTCRTVCRTQSDCGAGEVCTPRGVCDPTTGGPTPQILGVLGNEAGDIQRIRDGLIIDGVNLGNAAFELRPSGGTALALLVRSASAERAEVVLPEDIRSGAYDLVATNLAGSDQAPVTLTLPELTGDVLLDRINTEATGAFVFARLPTGAGAQQVAVGNHAHSQAELAAALQSGSLTLSGSLTAASASFSGSIRLGDTTAACTGALTGTLRYANGALEVCMAGGWTAIRQARDGSTAARAARSCKALLAEFPSSTDGLYWLDPEGQGDAFEAYCDMTTNGGGWTLVANIAPNDGNSVGYGNEDFWTKEMGYGSLVNRFSNDYKSAGAYRLAGTHLMIQSAVSGAAGSILGWRRWPLLGAPRTFTSHFDPVGMAYAWGSLQMQACDTGTADAVDAGTTNTSDAIIRQGTCLRADVMQTPGGAWPDMTRLTTSTGNSDNQAGGFATFIDGYASWNPAAPFMGLDHAGCASAACAYSSTCRAGADCAGNYCGGTYPAGLCGSVWNSRFYIR